MICQVCVQSDSLGWLKMNYVFAIVCTEVWKERCLPAYGLCCVRISHMTIAKLQGENTFQSVAVQISKTCHVYLSYSE